VITLNQYAIDIQHQHIWKKVSSGNQECYLAGSFSFRDHFYDSSNILTLLTSEDFDIRNVQDFNGNFAIIFTDGQQVIAVTDKKRSIPIYYYFDENTQTWVFTDHLQNFTGFPFHRTSVKEMILTGYVANERTLLEGVYQMEAGQYVVANGQDLHKERYFSYYHQPQEMELEEAAAELKEVFYRVFSRLYERVKNRDIIIPLSGGYDSRIIALFIKEFGLERVLSFTYGKPENPEAKKSREIAEKLGFEWTIIPYSKAQWQDWYASSEWKGYVDFASNYSTTAHIQDWPAVKELVQRLKEKSVFIPGHTGDFIAGGHIPYELTIDQEYTIEDVVRYVLKKHHRLWEMINEEAKEDVISEIKQSISSFAFTDKEQASALFEFWDWKERQAKFIINSVRVYEYFGHEWEIPLWDDELIEFFLKMPVKLRYKKYLYDYTLHLMYPAFFDKPKDPNGQVVSVQKKYGILYPILKKLYNQKRLLQQYFTDPMEWFGITGSYVDYVRKLSFHMDGVQYHHPYNINSFLVMDYIKSVKG
jgi:asparagine synthase (glutamine-hydrolysing)